MKQEDKELLLKDLCVRLPYGVKGLALGSRDDTISVLVPVEYPLVKTTTGLVCHLCTGQFKPYLRPLSSMTEEEVYKLQEILGKGVEIRDGFISIIDSSRTTFSYIELQAVFDYLNSIHVDYHGLIPRGLAIEAPEDMYKL